MPGIVRPVRASAALFMLVCLQACNSHSPVIVPQKAVRGPVRHALEAVFVPPFAWSTAFARDTHPMICSILLDLFNFSLSFSIQIDSALLTYVPRARARHLWQGPVCF